MSLEGILHFVYALARHGILQDKSLPQVAIYKHSNRCKTFAIEVGCVLDIAKPFHRLEVTRVCYGDFVLVDIILLGSGYCMTP